MPHAIVIEPDARADLADAASYYEVEQEGLGFRFLSETRDFLSVIAEQPSCYPHYRRQTHAVRIPKFPYLVLYRFDDQTVWVLAVLHGARSPRVFRKRAQ